MPPCQDTVRFVITFLHDIQAEDRGVSRFQQAQREWEPPLLDILKINVDGSFQPESNNGALGFINRNHEGSAVLAGAGNLGPVHDALMAETMAFKQALEAAEYFGISRIVLETDSSLLKEAVTSTTRDLVLGGGLFKDIRA